MAIALALGTGGDDLRLMSESSSRHCTKPGPQELITRAPLSLCRFVVKHIRGFQDSSPSPKQLTTQLLLNHNIPPQRTTLFWLRWQEQVDYRRRLTEKRLPPRLGPEMQRTASQEGAEGSGHPPNGAPAPPRSPLAQRPHVPSHSQTFQEAAPGPALCRTTMLPTSRCTATAPGAQPTETRGRKSQGNGRPAIQSIAAPLARGTAAAPWPIAPAGSGILLLLLLLSLCELPRCRMGCRATSPVSGGL